MSRKLRNGRLVDSTPAEIAEKEAREAAWANGAFDRELARMTEERDKRLRETDHLFLTDSPIASLEMQTYRATLRTLFDGVATIEALRAITFPDKPAE